MATAAPWIRTRTDEGCCWRLFNPGKAAYKAAMKICCAALSLLIVLTGCASPRTVSRTPMTVSTIGPAFAEYSIETVDRNGDKAITRQEWVAAGGSVKSFRVIDSDRNEVLTAGEISQASSTDRFFAFAKRTIDTGGNTEMTPQSFRSPAGARLLSFEF